MKLLFDGVGMLLGEAAGRRDLPREDVYAGAVALACSAFGVPATMMLQSQRASIEQPMCLLQCALCVLDRVAHGILGERRAATQLVLPDAPSFRLAPSTDTVFGPLVAALGNVAVRQTAYAVCAAVGEVSVRLNLTNQPLDALPGVQDVHGIPLVMREFDALDVNTHCAFFSFLLRLLTLAEVGYSAINLLATKLARSRFISIALDVHQR